MKCGAIGLRTGYGPECRNIVIVADRGHRRVLVYRDGQEGTAAWHAGLWHAHGLSIEGLVDCCKAIEQLRSIARWES